MCRVVRKGIGSVEKGTGQVLFRQIIKLPRSLFMMDDQLAGGVKLLQRRPRGIGLSSPVSAPVDMGMPVHLSLNWQTVGACRTMLTKPGNRLLLQPVKPLKTPAALPGCPAVAFKIRPVLHRPDGQVLIRIIHQTAVLIQKRIQHVFGKSLHPGLQRQLRIFAADIHRVKLDTSSLPHIFQGSLFSFETVRSQKPLLSQNKLPCLPVC